MKRDLAQITGKQHDVLIIGGGIYGICAAWEAALRGLSVALVEKGDFGSATSSNSLKIIHGGLRYLQHADFRRMRESISERRTLMRIAPHLVHPLPCLMPTYGHALKGKEIMALALLLNDLIGFDRNGLADPQKFMPRGRVLSKDECKQLIPGVDEEGLSGGALWYDCQVYNTERMLISILRSAVEAGAVVANYVEMLGFKKNGDRVTGIVAKDTLSGDEFDITAKLVINNTGPWVNIILSKLDGRLAEPRVKLSAAMNLVVRKQLNPKYAVGIWSKSQFKDEDALISKGSRLLFVTPWRDYSLVGTTHIPYQGDTEQFKITEKNITAFMQEVNEAYPAAKLRREDVTYFYGGLLPIDGYNHQTGDVKLLKHYQIIDHKKEDNVEGLISVISVKYTTARDVATKTIDYAFHKLGNKAPKSQTSVTPIFGGNIEQFEDFLHQEKSKAPKGLNERIITQLVYNYGSEYHRILNLCDENPEWGDPLHDTSQVLKAEVLNAIRDEMALKLSDVVFRRTELGSAGNPGDESLKSCATIMATELGWDKARVQKELEEVRNVYSLSP
ncbi:MAG: glycerol-3-phosphate dehydrogenase/oxidase [bacterium]